MEEVKLIELIKEYFNSNNHAPTIAAFSKMHNIHASSIIKAFGSWNNLLKKAGLKPNKSNKRSDDQLILWLKTHPNAKYADIPFGIRSALEERFGSITNARNKAGVPIIDWRALSQKRKRNPNAGRPIEYSEEAIIIGLHNLATKLGRPPRMKDVNKKSCGFPKSAILSRFSTFNNALSKANLPPVYSYHELNKLENELEKLMVNIKIAINDVPKAYCMQIDNYKPKFVYENRWEEIKLTRNDICSSIIPLLKWKEKCNDLIVYYLVDDSLYENDNIKMMCIMDFVNILNDKMLIERIYELRLRYDEINRKYLWEKQFSKQLGAESNTHK